MARARAAMVQGARGNDAPPNKVHPGRYYTGKGAVVDPLIGRMGFFRSLLTCLEATEVTKQGGAQPQKLEPALARFESVAKAAHRSGGQVFFIGNGGSAAIASHMAVDYSKNKGIRSSAFNDGPMLTCLSNDYGYDRVFSKQLEYHATKNDVVVIISTSGRSLNIVSAADTARALQCRGLFTFSGMNPNNQLRQRGDLNFYTPCADYGLVEISHLTLLHSVASR